MGVSGWCMDKALGWLTARRRFHDRVDWSKSVPPWGYCKLVLSVSVSFRKVYFRRTALVACSFTKRSRFPWYPFPFLRYDESA